MIWPTCGIGEEKHTGRVRLVNTAVRLTCRQLCAVQRGFMVRHSMNARHSTRQTHGCVRPLDSLLSRLEVLMTNMLDITLEDT